MTATGFHRFPDKRPDGFLFADPAVPAEGLDETLHAAAKGDVDLHAIAPISPAQNPSSAGARWSCGSPERPDAGGELV